MVEPRVAVVEGDRVPAPLRLLPRPCRRLHVRGRLPPLDAPRVAVVGTRVPSSSGRRIAYEIGRELARNGVVVVSGLARGIDAAAHQGALDGGGITVAFLGSGIDVITPRSSRLVGEAILERGAVASEYPPGMPALAHQFVERNRLVAAYTLGTVVVEGGAHSGALITAGLAVGLGRELWAVPGDPCRASTRGSNRLLRDGAGAVLEGADVLAALGLLTAGTSSPPGELPLPPGISSAERDVLACLEREGTANPEAIARATGLSASALLEALSMLELGGRIRRDGEGYAIER